MSNLQLYLGLQSRLDQSESWRFGQIDRIEESVWKGAGSNWWISGMDEGWQYGKRNKDGKRQRGGEDKKRWSEEWIEWEGKIRMDDQVWQGWMYLRFEDKSVSCFGCSTLSPECNYTSNYRPLHKVSSQIQTPDGSSITDAAAFISSPSQRKHRHELGNELWCSWLPKVKQKQVKNCL